MTLRNPGKTISKAMPKLEANLREISKGDAAAMIIIVALAMARIAKSLEWTDKKLIAFIRNCEKIDD